MLKAWTSPALYHLYVAVQVAEGVSPFTYVIVDTEQYVAPCIEKL